MDNTNNGATVVNTPRPTNINRFRRTRRQSNQTTNSAHSTQNAQGNRPKNRNVGKNRNSNKNRNRNNRRTITGHRNKIRSSVNVPKKRHFPDQVIHTADATNWGDSSTYRFKDFQGSKLKVIPISGVEMIGTNCTVLEYENDIIIIDAGLGFPEYELTGIDALVPNLTYLADKLDKVRGLVITHGHTDHIGGLHYIYDKIGFPTIYAPRLAAEMIREKFKETPFSERLKIQEIDGNSSYYLGKFHLSHFRMNHTIMDNYGICIDTPVGRVVTPSDYKFDLTPYKESPSDYSKLAKLGDEGVLLLMDESTNVKIKGWAPSESAIAADLENTIRDAHGRLIIGIFSTMISRIRQIVEISGRYGKKIVVFGRSLDTNVKISHRLGYIDVLNSDFIAPEEMHNYSDDSIVILTTGSQGEPNAALMRMALDEHNRITLKKSDTVVFSSSRIPGNENKIDKLINLIASKGCRILTNEHLTLHASGHGCKEDHKLILQLLKPKFIMPIHGEPSMLTANKENAMSLGYRDENIIISQDGSVIELWHDGWQINDKINSEPLLVEGNRIVDFDMEIIRERRIMTDEGVVILTLKNYTAQQFSENDIEFMTKGFFVQKTDSYLKRELPASILNFLNKMNPDRDKETIRNSLRSFIEKEIEKMYEKKPLVVVSVL